MVRGGEISSEQKFTQRVRSKDNNGSDDSDEDYVVSDEENEVSACSEEEEYCSSLDGYPSEASDPFVERKVRTKAKKVNNRSKTKKKKKKMPNRHCVSFKDEEEDEDDDDVDDKDYDENEDAEEEFTEGKLKARRGFSSARKNGVKISQKRRRVGHKEVDEDEDENEHNDDEDEDEDKDYDEDEGFTEGKLKARGGFSSARKNGVKISQKSRKVGHKEEDEDENEDDDDDGADEDYDEDEEFTVRKSKARGGISSVQKNGVKPFRKRRKAGHEEDDDEEFMPSKNEEDENEDEDEEFTEEGKSISRGGFSSVEKNGVKPSQKRRRVGHGEEDDDEEFTPSNNEDEEEEEEEEEEEDDDNDDVEDDEDFTAEEDESLDEELPRVKVKKKTYRKTSKRVSNKTSLRGRKRRKRSVASKKPKPPKRKKSRKPRGLRRKLRSDDEEEGLLSSREQGEELKRGPKRRRFVIDSDSDFTPSAHYDDNYEYTISEEEREQVREAKEFCRSKAMPEKVEAVFPVERKLKGRKGKEKVVEEEEKRPEATKRVCGICLSEEDKRRVRGTINCCEHYFCFTCISEWAKVESRCPLCKQRFNKITKRPRSSLGVVGPRVVTVDVPERDQVYQPTEEELRSYLYPYEDVICSECHLGGHDHLMLLCDECDSSAHTFCVGLGHEVPEGSWFCCDCKPLEPESPNSHSQTRSLSSDERPQNNSAPPPTNSTTGFEGFDLNSVSPASGLPSPRNQFGGFQAATTALVGAGAGGGASTVSGRIRLRHQIHHCLSERPDRPEATNQRESSEFFEERFRENSFTRARETDSLSPDLSNPTTESSGFVNGVTLWPRLEERNPLPDHDQRFQQCNGGRQEVDFLPAKEHLQLMVKSHLKNLSRGTDLAQSKLEEIAKCSTQTILVACELELRNINEVASVSVSQPPTCDHIELLDTSRPSLVRGCCSSCFDSFIVDIVKKILDAKLSEEPRWLCLDLSL